MENNISYQHIISLFTEFDFSPLETTKTVQGRGMKMSIWLDWDRDSQEKNTKHSTNVWRVQTPRRKNNNIKGKMINTGSLRQANQWLRKYISNIHWQQYKPSKLPSHGTPKWVNSPLFREQKRAPPFHCPAKAFKCSVRTSPVSNRFFRARNACTPFGTSSVFFHALHLHPNLY